MFRTSKTERIAALEMQLNEAQERAGDLTARNAALETRLDARELELSGLRLTLQGKSHTLEERNDKVNELQEKLNEALSSKAILQHAVDEQKRIAHDVLARIEAGVKECRATAFAVMTVLASEDHMWSTDAPLQRTLDEAWRLAQERLAELQELKDRDGELRELLDVARAEREGLRANNRDLKGTLEVVEKKLSASEWRSLAYFECIGRVPVLDLDAAGEDPRVVLEYRHELTDWLGRYATLYRDARDGRRREKAAGSGDAAGEPQRPSPVQE